MKVKEAYLVARAVVRVMADSERTSEIHVVEELTGMHSFRKFLSRLAGQADVEELLSARPELCDEHVDYDALRGLPAATLGYSYVHHLDDNGLSAASQAALTSHVDDQVLAYLMRRFRQTHDVWHTLTGLGVAGHEEVIIHAFSWGQMRLPVSALVVVLGSLKHLVLEARWRALRHALWEAYANGRAAAPLLPVYWERMWEVPLEQVRSDYNIRPCTPEYVHRD
jgi:ubiquinone biosynthesis protein COQ4